MRRRAAGQRVGTFKSVTVSSRRKVCSDGQARCRLELGCAWLPLPAVALEHERFPESHEVVSVHFALRFFARRSSSRVQDRTDSVASAVILSVSASTAALAEQLPFGSTSREGSSLRPRRLCATYLAMTSWRCRQLTLAPASARLTGLNGSAGEASGTEPGRNLRQPTAPTAWSSPLPPNAPSSAPRAGPCAEALQASRVGVRP